MKRPTLPVLAACALLAISFCVNAKDIRILCPYVGFLQNTYEDDESKMNLKDDALLKGLFFQWINPELFQGNAFIYQSSDINYSDLWGGHMIFDYYLFPSEKGKWVAGAGAEIIRIDMDAGKNIVPFTTFTMLNTILAPYLRAGYRFERKFGNLSLAVLPWAGAEYDRVRGDMAGIMEMTVDPNGPMPPPPMLIRDTVDENIKDDEYYGLAGLNLNASLFHMLDLEAKYNGVVNGDDYLNRASAMVNFFFHRHMGLSYRFKYMELTTGSNIYNMFGIALVF